MIRKIACFLLVFGSISSCTKRPVFVRFKNITSENFTHIDGEILGKAFSFDSLRSGYLTSAVAVPESYYYCYMRVMTKRDTLRFRPVDYVGEKRYTRGKLTMEVSIDSAKGHKGGLVRFINIDAARGRTIRHLKEAIHP